MKSFVVSSHVDQLNLHCVDFCESMDNPKMILQICHGMAEHIERYNDFAQFLAKEGVKVYGMDNRGHGQTAVDGLLGHIADEEGHLKLIEDVHSLNQYIKTQHPDTKVFILGHSMGSMIVRNYLNKYDRTVDGAIICGTSGLYNGLHKASKQINKLLLKLGKKRDKSQLMNSLAFLGFNKRIKPQMTDVDWLSRDKETIQQYREDAFCGFLCTNQFFADVVSLIENFSKAENLASIHRDLPLLFIAGKEDPVGEYGSGVEKSCEFYKSLGFKNVELKLYDGMRHEVLNELDKDMVYDDVLAFLQRQV